MSARRAARWGSWLFGLALLAAVIIAALHFSEERAFVRLVKTVSPWWLAVAVSLQALTYLAQGQVWRTVAKAAGVGVSVPVAWRLSLAKLFVDQALPSAGLSGTVVVARAFEHRGLPRPVVLAAVIVDTVAYYGVYVLTLCVALVITIVRGHASPLILAAAVVLVLISAALTSSALWLSGRKVAGPRWMGRVPLLEKVLLLLGQADKTLVRSVPVVLRCAGFHLAIVLLDASTLWVLLLSLGDLASPTGVFASFMITSLIRTIGVVPGGLGVFEAGSVVTLKLAGVAVPEALAATLLFRGLSFWLPMVPGLLFSRVERTAS